MKRLERFRGKREVRCEMFARRIWLFLRRGLLRRFSPERAAVGQSSLRSSAHHLAAALRDQPRGALVAPVDPEPAQRDAEPVAQADQEVDVRDAPDPPGEGAAELDRSEIDYREPLADLCQAAGMLVTKRSGRAAGQPRLDGFGDVASLLLGR